MSRLICMRLVHPGPHLLATTFYQFFLVNSVWVASSIPARSHTFMQIDYKIISTFILLPSFKKGLLVAAMTIAVDLGHKATKQTNNRSF